MPGFIVFLQKSFLGSDFAKTSLRAYFAHGIYYNMGYNNNTHVCERNSFIVSFGGVRLIEGMLRSRSFKPKICTV